MATSTGLDIMSEENEASKSHQVQEQLNSGKVENTQRTGISNDEEEVMSQGEQRKSREDRQESVKFSRVGTETDELKPNAESQVYTATKDTLFPQEISHSKTHALVSMYC